MRIFPKVTFLSLCLTKGVVFFFFRGKVTTPLTHSFWRLAVFFFSRSGKKKIRPRNSENQKIWTKFQKSCYQLQLISSFEKLHIHTLLSDFWAKMVIEDIPSVFFFSRESWERKKKYRKFHSNFTHSLLFGDFLAKRNFSREKKNTTPLHGHTLENKIKTMKCITHNDNVILLLVATIYWIIW